MRQSFRGENGEGFPTHPHAGWSSRHFFGLCRLPVFPQQPRSPAENSENIAVLPLQPHLRALCRWGNFLCSYRIQFKREMIRVPKVDIEGTAVHLDFPLFKALAPAVRVLANQVLLQIFSLRIRQRRVQPDLRASPKLPSPDLQRRDGADHFLLHTGILFRIERIHQVFPAVCFHRFLDILPVLCQIATRKRKRFLCGIYPAVLIHFFFEKLPGQRGVNFYRHFVD